MIILKCVLAQGLKTKVNALKCGLVLLLYAVAVFRLSILLQSHRIQVKLRFLSELTRNATLTHRAILFKS